MPHLVGVGGFRGGHELRLGWVMLQRGTLRSERLAVNQEPPSLELILSEVSAAVRRAFAEGYRIGTQDAADKMTRALAGSISSSNVPNPLTVGAANVHALAFGRPLSDRGTGYGRMITNIRKAIVSAPDIGLTREDLLKFCFRQGVEVNPNQFKDTIKRLVTGGEIIRRHLAYYKGPKLRLDLIPLDTPGMNQS